MATQSVWRLESVSPELGGRQFDIQGTMSVGRAQESDICIALIGLSRRHARITVCEDGLLVEDLDSSNGTYINNARIDKAVAVPGDIIGFDTLQFVVSGPQVDVYSEKTSVRTAIDPQRMAQPPKPLGPTAIEKQMATLKQLPPKGLGESQPVLLKRKSKIRERAGTETRFFDSEWGKFIMLLAGLVGLLGVVVLVANMATS